MNITTSMIYWGLTIKKDNLNATQNDAYKNLIGI
jgi:hypothetical protein